MFWSSCCPLSAVFVVVLYSGLCVLIGHMFTHSTMVGLWMPCSTSGVILVCLYVRSCEYVRTICTSVSFKLAQLLHSNVAIF